MSLACSNSISRRKSVLVQPAQCESMFLHIYGAEGLQGFDYEHWEFCVYKQATCE